MAKGPLVGLKVIELGTFGPVPFCGMMLSDLGADVVRIERPDLVSLQGLSGTRFQFDARGRRSVELNLKSADGVAKCLALMEKADIVLEGYRPGVVERLGIGPDAAFQRNPRLIYGRLTGYGQTGPYAQLVGHDPNFFALSGLMHLIGTKEKPVMPLVLVADYGGAMTHVAGILAALHHVHQTGKGQVVDTSTAETSAYMGTIIYSMIAAGMWGDQRESNFLDGGAPFVGNFCCSDGRWVTIGASEPKHWSLLLEKLGLAEELKQSLSDRASWPAMRAAVARAFASKTQRDWREVMDGAETCFAPILTPAEAFADPHNVARQTFLEVDGAMQPAPVPRFSLTPGEIQGPPPARGQHTAEVLAEWGVDNVRCQAGE